MKSANIISYSEMFTLIKNHIESIGCIIDQFAFDLPDDIFGRISYEDSKIMLNCPSAKDAVFTLLHEGGHWLSYLRWYKRDNLIQPDREKREELAYKYGWILIKQLNLPISKEDWKKEEYK